MSGNLRASNHESTKFHFEIKEVDSHTDRLYLSWDASGMGRYGVSAPSV